MGLWRTDMEVDNEVSTSRRVLVALVAVVLVAVIAVAVAAEILTLREGLARSEERGDTLSA